MRHINVKTCTSLIRQFRLLFFNGKNLKVRKYRIDLFKVAYVSCERASLSYRENARECVLFYILHPLAIIFFS